MSDETLTLNIHQRMLAVMTDISYVQKSEKKVNEQYRFVTHDSVTAMVRGALLTHRIVATTHVLGHTQDGNRTSVDIRVEFINVDSPEDRVTVNAFGYGIDPQDKGPGKAISYAVKYAYLKAFALETGDDPERDSIDHKPATPATPAARVIAGNKTPGREAFDALGDEGQRFVTEYAEVVTNLYDTKGDVMGYLAMNILDADEKTAMWNCLRSDVRSAIKKSAAETKPKEAA